MIRGRVTRAQLLERVKDLETAGAQMLADLAGGDRPEYAAGGFAGRCYRMVRSGKADARPVSIPLPEISPAECPDLLHPDDTALLIQSLQEHIDGKTAFYDVEYRLLAGGTPRRYRERGAVTLRDANGVPLLLAADLYDLTGFKPGQTAAECGNPPGTDLLTGMKGRSAMIECLETAAERAEFLKEPLSVVMFDIDDFRNFNEVMGSAVGDSALRGVARIIQANVRETDTAGRYGGEEFLVLFPRADARAAEAVAERIRCEIAMNEFSVSIPITVSGGVMQYAGESLEALINGAEKALLAAKAAGKNRIALY
jgi:diguanylate cyclase